MPVLVLTISLLLPGCLKAESSETETRSAASVTRGNRILNLYDAFGEPHEDLVMDFGFSALIEYEGTTILFDAGTDADILRRNAEALGVDLRKVDFAIGSHSHADHISGFDYLLEVNPDVRIYLPKDFFGLGAPLRFGISGPEPGPAESLPERLRYFGGEKQATVIAPSGRFWRANVEYVTENVEIAKGIRLIATSSPFMGTFSRYPNLDPQGNPIESETSFIGLPELSLALDDDDGQVLVVGCSHSTVEAIVRETIGFTGKDVGLVMGGYHLLPYGSEEVGRVAARLKDDLSVERVAPAHCTGQLAFEILSDVYGRNYLFAGLGAEIEF